MSTYPINRIFAACLLIGLPLSSAYAIPQASNGTTPAPAKKDQTKTAPKQKNKVIFGDVEISDYDTTDSSHFITFTFAVKNPSKGQVKVETINKKRKTHMVVLADHVEGNQKQKGHEVVDFTGHVHYTITETILKKVGGDTHSVERVVTGSAQSARYTASDKKLHMSNEVDAKIVDPDRFDGPATLHVDDLTLENTENEAHYLLKGNPNTNDIRFTPHVESAPQKSVIASPAVSKSDKKSSQDKIKKVAHAPAIGVVHVHHFANGVFLTGQNLTFDGPLVTIETVNSIEKSQNTLKAPHIKANLVEEQQSIEATGGIHFDSRSTIVKNAKSVTQILAGTADQATWKKDKPLEVNGSIEATLTNPDMLMEPATLSATHLTAGLGDNPKYVVTGAEAKTHLTLWPRPLPTHTQGAKEDKQSKVNTKIQEATKPVLQEAALSGKTEAQAGQPNQNSDQKEKTKEADADSQDVVGQSTSANSAPFAFGRIVVTKFHTATYEPDKSLIVEGTKVDFTSTDTSSNSFAELQAPRFEADFDVMNNTISAARATKNVDYKFQQLHKIKTDLQVMTGKGRAVTFTNTVTDGRQSQIVKVEGVTSSDIVNQEGKGAHLKLNGNESEAWQVYNLITQDYHLEDPLKQTTINLDPEYVPAELAEIDKSAPKKTKKKK